MFDKYIIVEDGFRNVVEGGEVRGFQVKARLPYYRGLATVLVMGMTPTEVMLAVFARASDPNSGGRQMPAHYSSRKLRIITQSSPVGTQIAHAAGVGLAEKIPQGNVDSGVASCFNPGRSPAARRTGRSRRRRTSA